MWLATSINEAQTEQSKWKQPRLVFSHYILTLDSSRILFFSFLWFGCNKAFMVENMSSRCSWCQRCCRILFVTDVTIYCLDLCLSLVGGLPRRTIIVSLNGPKWKPFFVGLMALYFSFFVSMLSFRLFPYTIIMLSEHH